MVGNRFDVHYDHDDCGHMLPGSDGRFIYTARGKYTATVKAVGDAGRQGGAMLFPATHGPFYVKLDMVRGKNDPRPATAGTALICIEGTDTPVAQYEKFDLGMHLDRWGRLSFGPDKRIFLIPHAKILVQIPVTDDKLILVPMDLEKALEKSDAEFLYVTSRPPQAFAPGSSFAYDVAVKSRKGGVKFSLDSGPRGMTINAVGRITWEVPADLAEPAQVIVSISDAGDQQLVHQFTLRPAGQKK